MRSLWAFPLTLPLAAVVSARQESFSVTNHDLLAFPQYDVVHENAHITTRDAELFLQAQDEKASERHPHDSASNDEDAFAHYSDDTEYLEVKLRGRRHLCAIPRLSSQAASDNETEAAESLAEREKELVRASNHGWKLLEPMQGKCIYYPQGWWMVSFCHNEGVKQFHPLPPGPTVPPYPPLEDPNVPGFVLGRFDKPLRIEAHSNEDNEQLKPLSDEQRDSGKALSSHVQQQGEANFLVQKLGGGTECDLTGEERQVTVQFHCNPGSNDKIAVFKETASCVYLMVIHTPKLCGDIAFQPPQIDKPNYIRCAEIVADDEVGAWKAGKSAEAAHDLISGEQNFAQQQNLVIGGIEVGAKKLVGGSPERTIKGSNIIKPRELQLQEQERYVATVAKSDGKYTSVLSEKEIKKLGLKSNADDIAEMVAKVEKLAPAGNPWRLEVIEAPGGMHMKAIIGDDSDEPEEPEQPEEARRAHQAPPTASKGTNKNPSQPPSRDDASSGDPEEEAGEGEEESGSQEEYKGKSEL